MTTTQKYAKEVEDIIYADYSDYRVALKQAWEWNRSGNSDKVTFAKDLLEVMTSSDDKIRPYWSELNALPIWFERAFNFTKLEKPDLKAALKLIEEKIAPAFWTSPRLAGAELRVYSLSGGFTHGEVTTDVYPRVQVGGSEAGHRAGILLRGGRPEVGPARPHDSAVEGRVCDRW